MNGKSCGMAPKPGKDSMTSAQKVEQQSKWHFVSPTDLLRRQFDGRTFGLRSPSKILGSEGGLVTGSVKLFRLFHQTRSPKATLNFSFLSLLWAFLNLTTIRRVVGKV
jgi:hypothetical protein